ncbi:MAG: hypothetical protein IJS99_10080 [Synergistaceae bacterium]|nr:hypothetical protein [Synergistaceae bacterium]
MIRKFLFTAMLIIFISAGCAFAGVDLGEGYHVPENFSSVLITSSDGTAIQNAVSHIQDGGTILLSGDFNLVMQINIKKNITIKGTTNKAILDGTAANDRVIRCEGNITLENLVIRGGDSSNGGGVKLDGGEVNIISCDITGNKSLLGGGGIYSQAAALTLTNCNISDNTVNLLGGGIAFLGGKAEITGCKINNNSAFQGGGIALASVTITMNNSQVTSNTAKEIGGGVYLPSGTLIASSCDISGNTASASADIALQDGATYTIN